MGNGDSESLNKSKCQDLPKFQSLGGGGGGAGGGQGGILHSVKSKCQDLPYFDFRGVKAGYSETEKLKCQASSLISDFPGAGGGGRGGILNV